MGAFFLLLVYDSFLFNDFYNRLTFIFLDLKSKSQCKTLIILGLCVSHRFLDGILVFLNRVDGGTLCPSRRPLHRTYGSRIRRYMNTDITAINRDNRQEG